QRLVIRVIRERTVRAEWSAPAERTIDRVGPRRPVAGAADPVRRAPAVGAKRSERAERAVRADRPVVAERAQRRQVVLAGVERVGGLARRMKRRQIAVERLDGARADIDVGAAVGLAARPRRVGYVISGVGGTAEPEKEQGDRVVAHAPAYSTRSASRN